MAGTASRRTVARGGRVRFVTASDGHLGQPGTDSRRYLAEFVAAVNRLHAATPLDFAVINGDIGHGGVGLLKEARGGLDQLAMPYFVAQGNHDEVDADDWESAWDTPPDHVQRIGALSLVIANTSNKAGEYLCADESWLARALDDESGQDHVLVFMHITPNTWTTYGIACPAVRRVLARAGNLRAVFNGHDHDQVGVKVDAGLHYFFDAHYGGLPGTPYRAFRLAELTDNELTTRLVTVEGEQKDQSTISW